MAGYVLHLKEEESVTLSAATLKRLIGGGNGDAALLYLAILHSHGAAEAEKLAAMLKWDEARVRAAEQALCGMQLVGAPEKKAAPLPPEPPQAQETPDYTREDIMRKLEGDGRFACLLREVEHKLGPLSIPSVKKLLGLYENLGLPADVVYTLVNYCITKKAQQFGEGLFLLASCSFGAVAIPLVCAWQGFTLSFAVACFAGSLGQEGVLLSLAAFGLRSVVVLPCTLLVAQWAFDKTLCRLRGESAAGTAAQRWRLIGCFIVLILGAVLEMTVVPRLFTLALSRLS